ncbi:MAG: Fic family protein [Gammaproteobacteria bacterium]|nr:Fic family protein [Gammaproteobacteria bacterium]
MSFRDDYVIPISAAAASISETVRAPIQQRRPVGYSRSFLDDYEPNVTAYLSAEARDHLAELGESPDRDQPAGTYARKIHERLLIDLSWNSSRLEGNTYSLLETERLLELGESADHDAREAQMILNHKAAIELLIDQAEHVGFNRYTVLNLHALLAENLLADSAAWGRLRAATVDIGGSTYHPLAVPQLIEECFEQILHKADAIDDPFEQAFFALVQLPYLQPFLDVNKRVSRLVANLPLIRANLCPLSFVDVPTKAYVDGLLGVYEQNRVELLRDVFCWAYERSCARYSTIRQSLGEPDPMRTRYRSAIVDAVSEVVRTRLDKKGAHAHIVRRAAALPPADAARLVEIVEADLSNLHEGNIARARLTPSEFDAWRAQWR